MPCIISTENWLYFQLVVVALMFIITLIGVALIVSKSRHSDIAVAVSIISAFLFFVILIPLFINYDYLSIYHSSPDSVYCEQTKVRFK